MFLNKETDKTMKGENSQKVELGLTQGKCSQAFSFECSEYSNPKYFLIYRKLQKHNMNLPRAECTLGLYEEGDLEALRAVGSVSLVTLERFLLELCSPHLIFFLGTFLLNVCQFFFGQS